MSNRCEPLPSCVIQPHLGIYFPYNLNSYIWWRQKSVAESFHRKWGIWFIAMHKAYIKQTRFHSSSISIRIVKQLTFFTKKTTLPKRFKVSKNFSSSSLCFTKLYLLIEIFWEKIFQCVYRNQTLIYGLIVGNISHVWTLCEHWRQSLLSSFQNM